MADSFISKLITELTAKTTASDTDLVPIADSSGNFFKMTFAKLKELITSELNTKIGWVQIFSGSRLFISDNNKWHDSLNFADFARIKITFVCQGYCSTAEFVTQKVERHYAHTWGYMNSDGLHRQVTVDFLTAGRYLDEMHAYMQQDNGRWTSIPANVYISEIYGCNNL